MPTKPLTDAEIAELRGYIGGDPEHREYWSEEIADAAERLLGEVEQLREEIASRDLDDTVAILVRRLGGEAVITLAEKRAVHDGRTRLEVAVNKEEGLMRLRLIQTQA